MTSSPKPLLETVYDVLNISLDILQNDSDIGTDRIAEVEKAIANAKKTIDNYREKQSNKPYPKQEDMNRKG